MSEIEDQIGEMLKIYEVEDEVKDEEVKVEEEIVEDKEEEEVKEEKPEPIKPSEFETLKQEFDRLKGAYEEIVNKKVTPPEVPEVIPEQDFLDGMDLDDLVNNPKEFNKLLNKVFSKGLEFAEQKTNEIKKKLPETIRNNVVTIESLRKASEGFYNDNKDLAPFKGAVATVFNELQQLNPTMSYDKLLNKTEVEVRNRLGIVKQKEEKKSDSPRLPKTKSTARTIPEDKVVDPIISDIEKMNESLNRR